MQTLPALAGSGLPAHRRDAAAPALEAKASATRRACRQALARPDAHLADSGQSPATCSLAIAGLPFQGALRRSEVAALERRDVEPATSTPGAFRIGTGAALPPGERP